MLVKKVMDNNGGSILISVLLGLGLAAMFRRACHGDGCIVVKSPKMAEVRENVYKIQTDCYRYTPEVVPCPWGGIGIGGDSRG
jgi:hypothetical protein